MLLGSVIYMHYLEADLMLSHRDDLLLERDQLGVKLRKGAGVSEKVCVCVCAHPKTTPSISTASNLDTLLLLLTSQHDQSASRKRQSW